MSKKVVQKREQASYDLQITFPDNKVLKKTNLSLYQLFENYFINLNNNLKNSNYSIKDAESIMNKYDELFKNCKVLIQYVDSWGHRWKGKVAWPKKDKFIEYLKERIINYETKSK